MHRHLEAKLLTVPYKYFTTNETNPDQRKLCIVCLLYIRILEYESICIGTNLLLTQSLLDLYIKAAQSGGSVADSNDIYP